MDQFEALGEYTFSGKLETVHLWWDTLINSYKRYNGTYYIHFSGTYNTYYHEISTQTGVIII